MTSNRGHRPRARARLAGAVLLGVVVLIAGPVLFVGANPADDGWTPRSKKPPNEDPADDGWLPRKPAIIPAGGQGPDLPPPKELGPDVLPPPKDSGPALPPKDLDVEPPRKPKVLPKPMVEDEPRPKGPIDPEKAILLGAARNAVKQKEWDKALARFDDVFRRYGDDPDVRAEYAGVLVQAGRARDALRAYAQAVAARPDDRKMRINFGDVAVLARDYTTAIAQFRKALDLRPDDPAVAVRLARAYVFDGDPARGQDVFDKKLKQVHPEDEDAPIQLPALLVDLGRPAEALTFVDALLQDRPNDPEILAARVRALARLGERVKAIEAIETLASRAPKGQTTWQELAEALYGVEDFEVAAAAYDLILRTDPTNTLALIGSARTHVALFHPQPARAILDGLKPPPEAMRVYRLAWAEYHRQVGEWAEAREQYRTILETEPTDPEARLGLAGVYERAREDEKAKAEYAKIPTGTGYGRRARLAIAFILTLQRKFNEACELPKAMLAEHAGDAAATAQLVRTLAKSGKVDQAVSIGRSFLVNNPRNETGQVTVRLALGRAFLDGHKPQAAVRVYEELLNRPGGRVPEAYYGMARALGMSGDADRSRHAIGVALTAAGGDTRNRLMLSDLFANDFDDSVAVGFVQDVTRSDPDNLAALTRLADVQGRLARPDGDTRMAAATAREILNQSPTNAPARLALARDLATAQDWTGAATEYEKLLATDPDLFVPQRERARVLYSGNDFGGGAAAYHRMQNPAADEQLYAALCGLAQRDPRVGLMLGPCLAAPGPGRMIKAEVTKAVAALGDPELSTALNNILIDYEARSTEQLLAKLEGDVKDKGWRPYEAIVAAKTALDVEPANTSLWFDLGQAQSTLRQTRGAIGTYAEQLGIDPREREAGIAMNRAGMELQPQLRLYPDIFGQKGRDGLAQVVRTRHLVGIRVPWGDEVDFCEVGYGHLNYRPTDDRKLIGDLLYARVQGRHTERLLAYAQVNLESYRDRIQDRPTFDAGLVYDCSDELRLRGSAFLENVVENGESMRQDIFRYGTRLGADYQHSRRWRATGTYTAGHYSDDNLYHDLYLTSEHTLCFAPKQLKLVLTADIYGYQEQPVLPTADPMFLFGMRHPYFAPDVFAYTEARLEWTHWLSRDYFAHADQCWYSLQYGTGLDTDLNHYHTLRALFQYDVKTWLSIGAEARATLSPVYDMGYATAYVIFRLPVTN
jgi:tetratricopeptide (TPR) repeat protein